MRVYCDNCKKDFEIAFRSTEAFVESTKIVMQYFSCPFCKKQYNVCFHTEKSNKIVETLEKQKEKKDYCGISKTSELLRKEMEENRRKHERLF